MFFSEYSTSNEAERKRQYRQRKKESKDGGKRKSNEYQRRWRLKKCSENINNEIAKFPNRQSKSRALKKLKKSLPKSPSKRAATVAAYLQCSTSPAVKSLQKSRLVASPEETKDIKLAEAVMTDLRDALTEKKKKRSDEFRIEVNSIMSSVCGETVAQNKCKLKLAKKLCLPARTVSKGHRIRTRVSKTDSSCFKYTLRKSRKSSVSDEIKKKIYDFWYSADIAHPTGNKNDVKRVRIGVKHYSSHAVYVLRKTHTEAFHDFKEKYPDINISQSTFERCKPYFVREARVKDRVTCCCRYHLEIKTVFKTCMDFRKKLAHSDNHIIYDNMYDMSRDTLCEPDGNGYFQKTCLDRQCSKCGIPDSLFQESELSTEQGAPSVTWEAYEYKNVQTKRGSVRKLLLTKRTTKPGDMFRHLIKLLQSFPSHNFRAKWQHQQFNNLVENLPTDHCVTVHDYSENYQCSEKVELQSSYFQKTEVSLHVTLIYRHAILEFDGKQSTPENPEIVCEQLFVISPDEQHDRHFTHQVQKEVADYLRSIAYTCRVMHEFCDGCAAQYKNRNCYGDLHRCCDEFGYETIVRNFYETSHSKGPQDAAGGFVKRQADLAILRGTVVIQNAKDLFEFANNTLRETKSNKVQKRHFRYCENVDRQNEHNYKPITGIRSTHQVVAHKGENAILRTRSLSCYECDACFVGCTENCKFSDIIGKTEKTNSNLHVGCEPDLSTAAEENIPMASLITRGSVFAVFCQDNDYEYYLVCADSPSYTLEKETTDNWGITWQCGTSVIKGFYYEHLKENPLKNKMIKKHMALVPSMSVVYIVETNVKSKISFTMPEDEHLKILEIVSEIDI